MTKTDTNKIPKIMKKVSKVIGTTTYGNSDRIFEPPLYVCSMTQEEYGKLVQIFTYNGVERFMRTEDEEGNPITTKSTYNDIIKLYLDDPNLSKDNRIWLTSLNETSQLRDFLVEYGEINSEIHCHRVASCPEYLTVDINDIPSSVNIEDEHQLQDYIDIEQTHNWDDDGERYSDDEARIDGYTCIELPRSPMLFSDTTDDVVPTP